MAVFLEQVLQREIDALQANCHIGRERTKESVDVSSSLKIKVRHMPGVQTVYVSEKSSTVLSLCRSRAKVMIGGGGGGWLVFTLANQKVCCWGRLNEKYTNIIINILKLII